MNIYMISTGGTRIELSMDNCATTKEGVIQLVRDHYAFYYNPEGEIFDIAFPEEMRVITFRDSANEKMVWTIFTIEVIDV